MSNISEQLKNIAETTKTFFCVKVGKKSGVYDNWDECKVNVIGFSGAVYKKFTNLESAKQYMDVNIVEPIETKIKTKTVQSSRVVSDDDILELETSNNVIHVFTDGSSITLNKTENITSYSIYFEKNDDRNTSKIIIGTNNKAELTAIVESLKLLQAEIMKGDVIVVNTDSQYSILCLTNNKKDPKKPNYDVIMEGYQLLDGHDNIKFHKISAHTHNTDKYSEGNREADKMANLILISDPKFKELKFTFGKYEGKTYEEIYNTDIEYYKNLVKTTHDYSIKLFYDIKQLE
jgi:ribonuclease HI